MLANRTMEAAHLLRRTGFGPTLTEIKKFSQMSHAQAVEQIMNFDSTQVASQVNLSHDLQAKGINEPDWWEDNMGQVWLNTILRTQYPLLEKMTLFWHGHFTSSIEKVGDGGAMLNQNQYFRQHALGNFATMLHDISRDPAMLLYLDGVDNSVDSTNENYAREVMELFSLGPGNYTEQDVREAARAFTGWYVDDDSSTPANYVIRYDPELHDNTPKTFMGQKGNWAADDIINIILQKRQVAYFITKKLWQFLAYPNPDPAIITRLGDLFYNSKYDIKKLVNAILLSPEFLSPQAYRALVKSPVEIVVGIVRSLGGNSVDEDYIESMGQVLFAPPNVGGWIGGKHWLNSGAFFNRVNYANNLMENDPTDPQYLQLLPALIASGNAPNQQIFQTLATLLLDNNATGLGAIQAFLNQAWQSDPSDKADRSAEYLARVRGVAQMMLCCPEFQLA